MVVRRLLSRFDGQFSRQNVHGRKPALPHGAQAQGIVALGQPATVVIHDQPAVIPEGVVEPKGAVKQNLARGGLQQVGATNHLSNSHGCLAGHAGNLIAWTPATPPDHKISKVLTGHKSLLSQVPILELDRFAVGNAETPVAAIWRFNVANSGTGEER